MNTDFEAHHEGDTPSAFAATSRQIITTPARDVFIIHGRDNGTKEMIARFISKLGLTPVMLHEQPIEGRTILEKFEAHINVAYAIALLTPDDIGALASEQDKLIPRARQNVIFEFDYFIGLFGRKRVCALVKDNIEKIRVYLFIQDPHKF